MLTHYLKINDSKTEFIIFGTRQQLQKCNIRNVNVGESTIETTQKIRNLGVLFDPQMQMIDHVNNVCKRGYYQLKKIRQVRKYLDNNSAEELVHSFVTSNIDYCNALLYGTPKCVTNKLQKLQNTAARVICNASKYDHATPLLKSLHWLPVKQRIQYKIALLTYKCLNDLAPDYLCDLIERYKPSRSLRSSQQLLLNVPRCRTITLGPRAFTSAAPRIWNGLPNDVRCSKTLESFKGQLKSFLFLEAFK